MIYYVYIRLIVQCLAALSPWSFENNTLVNSFMSTSDSSEEKASSAQKSTEKKNTTSGHLDEAIRAEAYSVIPIHIKRTSSDDFVSSDVNETGRKSVTRVCTSSKKLKPFATGNSNVPTSSYLVYLDHLRCIYIYYSVSPKSLLY